MTRKTAIYKPWTDAWNRSSSLQKDPTLPTPCFWTPSPWYCEIVSFSCQSYPVCGTFLWHYHQTNTDNVPLFHLWTQFIWNGDYSKLSIIICSHIFLLVQFLFLFLGINNWFAFYFFQFNVIFNQRIITLQYFCHTSTWISHRCTNVPSLLNLSPTSLSILPL